MPKDAPNKALMLSVMAAFKEGDLEPLFATLSPDVVWKSNAPKEFFRFGGIHRGMAGMKEYTAQLAMQYHFVKLEPRTITAKGDQVWGIFKAEAQHRPSGRYVRSDLSIRWTIADGRITAHQGFFDTASVLMQQGELAA
jgi:ketosteroid isomerase-like protein